MKSPSRSFLAAILTCAALYASSLFAAGEPPDQLVKNSVNEVLTAMQQHKTKQQLRQLAEDKIAPNFDFQQMTKLAVGRNWAQASPDQQKALESAFRALLLNTYTNALAQAKADDKGVDVQPLPQNAGNDVTVKTSVRASSGQQPISINYRMENSSGSWKVYDVAVENLSLVSTYRQSFDEAIQRSGVDGLIKQLQAKNQSLASN